MKAGKNICRYCGKEINGIACDCQSRLENLKLWDSLLRKRANKKCSNSKGNTKI